MGTSNTNSPCCIGLHTIERRSLRILGSRVPIFCSEIHNLTPQVSDTPFEKVSARTSHLIS